MSEFTNHIAKHRNKLLNFCLRIIHKEAPLEAIQEYQEVIQRVNHNDVIWVVDELMGLKLDMEELKTGVNKILNVFYEPLLKNTPYSIPEGGFLYFLEKNNTKLESLLVDIRPLIKQINNSSESREVKESLKSRFKYLAKFDKQYSIKENVLFPKLEEKWTDYRCVKVMWSFHDDIRRNLKEIFSLLDSSDFNLKRFNKLTGDIYFNMSAIKFREEKILFPKILETLSQEDLDDMLVESCSLNWAYIEPDKNLSLKREKKIISVQREIDLDTGYLLPDQIKLMMNHLPVDVTFVDENNKVLYYSTPKKRIFPRTNSILGRDVRNCHPHESVDVVEKIVESFRSGKKDEASFWIQLSGEYILIQYFAVRNEKGDYRGVVEVSQEISGIKAIQGEKRLLDWNN